MNVLTHKHTHTNTSWDSSRRHNSFSYMLEERKCFNSRLIIFWRFGDDGMKLFIVDTKKSSSILIHEKRERRNEIQLEFLISKLHTYYFALSPTALAIIIPNHIFIIWNIFSWLICIRPNVGVCFLRSLT